MFKVTTESRGIYYPLPKFSSWKLGEGKPERSAPIVELHASDKELSYIHAYFRGVPTVMCRDEVIWTGVYAQFIYDNL
jgi:hypothetical protein